MSITIIRNTGWTGWCLRIKIILNGEKINIIDENKSVEVKLPRYNSCLQVRQFGIKSNEIIVKDGDILEIKTKWWYQIIIPVMIVIQLLNFSITFLNNRFTILFSLIVFFIIISLFLIIISFNNGFYIKNITKNSL